MRSKSGAELCISLFVSKRPITKLPRITGDVKELCNIQRILVSGTGQSTDTRHIVLNYIWTVKLLDKVFANF